MDLEPKRLARKNDFHHSNTLRPTIKSYDPQLDTIIDHRQFLLILNFWRYINTSSQRHQFSCKQVYGPYS